MDIFPFLSPVQPGGIINPEEALPAMMGTLGPGQVAWGAGRMRAQDVLTNWVKSNMPKMQQYMRGNPF